jgi:hypothetical protein
MIRTWSVLAVAGLFAAVSAVPLAAMMHGDESPASINDILQKICARLDAIEKRLDQVDKRQTTQSAKPVLQIQVAKYGSAQSDALMDDIRRLSDMDHPVKFEFVRFGDTAPAFRWTDEDGNTITRQGYKSGTLHKIIEAIIGRPYPVEYAGPMFGNG